MNTSGLSEDDEFGLDSENNYIEFLKIENNMRPETSTQNNHYACSRNKPTTSAATTKTNKIVYQTYDENRPSNLAVNNKENPTKNDINRPFSTSTVTPTSKLNYRPYNTNEQLKLIQNKSNTKSNNNNASMHLPVPPNATIISQSSSLPPTSAFEEKITLIMTETLREVKLLRREFRDHQEKCTCHVMLNDEEPLLQIPANSVEAFQNLERDIKANNKTEIYLKKHYQTISDSSVEKYIRCCLKSIITDEAATYFSWKGQHGNIAVNSYLILKHLKDAVIKKFNARPIDIETTIKKWFQYAKDRQRIKQKKDALN